MPKKTATIRCPYPGCRSTDIMPPFRKSRRIFLLSSLFPRMRRWLCRACNRRFWWPKPRGWREPI